jgi:hypothetical protein
MQVSTADSGLFCALISSCSVYPLRRGLDDLLGPGGHSTLRRTNEMYDRFVAEYPDEDQRMEILLQHEVDRPMGEHGIAQSTHEFRRHFLYLRRLVSIKLRQPSKLGY